MPENLQKAWLRRLGRRVKQLRNLHGWSQEELAERAGNSVKQISDVELGKTNVGINAVMAIAAGFSLDVSELLRGLSGGGHVYVLTQQDLDRIEDALRVVDRVKRTRARRRSR